METFAGIWYLYIILNCWNRYNILVTLDETIMWFCLIQSWCHCIMEGIKLLQEKRVSHPHTRKQPHALRHSQWLCSSVFNLYIPLALFKSTFVSHFIIWEVYVWFNQDSDAGRARLSALVHPCFLCAWILWGFPGLFLIWWTVPNFANCSWYCQLFLILEALPDFVSFSLYCELCLVFWDDPDFCS